MDIQKQIDKDIVTTMKLRDDLQTDLLNTLRMAKSSLQLKAKELKLELTDQEQIGVLTYMVKTRKESIELFKKGDRPDLVVGEEAQIKMLKKYLPEEASGGDIAMTVAGILTVHFPNVTMKDLGSVIKQAKEAIAAGNQTADGKVLSETVKNEIKYREDARANGITLAVPVHESSNE